VDGQEAAAVLHEGIQSVELLGRDASVVCVEHDRIVALQGIRREAVGFGEVIEADAIALKRACQQGLVHIAVVVRTVVSEKKNTQNAGGLRAGGWVRETDCDRDG
jgi:hypothetical protein